MKEKLIVVLSVGFLLLSVTSASVGKAKGYLLIIGGGNKPPQALKEFIALSSNGRILIITSASGVPQESGPETVAEFIDAGARDVHWLHINSQLMANADSTVAQIDAAQGIFFTGGVQERLMQRLGGTRAEAAILKLYFKKGCIIGGTSAGAAVMSQVMITGNELINKDTTNAFVSIQAHNIETIRGLGFLDKVIIDQHFATRKRHNRLISLMLEYPPLLGIGIDEDTAILVYPDNKFRVYGQGSVIVYNARQAKSIHISENGNIGGQNIKMSILTEGDIYKIE